MLVADLTVEVRDSSLTRVGQILESDLVGSQFVPRFNNVGGWKIVLSATHPMADALRAPGAGIIVTLSDGTVILSGPTVSARCVKTSQDPDGVWEIEGSDDSVLLANHVAFPDPSTADVTAQASDYDTRTGVAETVMKAYVNANIGPTAPTARKVSALTVEADSARGETVTGKARFDRLGVLLESLAATSGLGFTIDQDGEDLVFRVFEPVDRSATVRMDVENQRLEKSEYAYTRPKVTRVIVAGQGAGVDRTFVEVSNTASTAAESDWAQRIEVFKDQRNTDDLTELTQAGEEILADGGQTVRSVSVSPSDDQTMRYGTDWGLGDRVTVVVGDEEVSQIVTEVAIVVTESGVKVGATVGDPKVAAASDPESVTAATTASQEERISNLERNEPAGGGGNTSGLAPIANPTFTGTATSPLLRLTDETDASVSSTGHAFQIGPSSGTNLIADGNEIMARNNGVESVLNLNVNGGNVTIGDATSQVTVNGNLRVGGTNYAHNPAGIISMWATGTAPTGWLICDGAAVSRTTYADLFAVIGTTYGAGNGSTTFTLPNLKGRVPVGLDSGQTEFDVLGETGGAKTHTLTTTEMPSHTHGPGALTRFHGGNTSTSRSRFAAGTSGGYAFQSGTQTDLQEFAATAATGGGGAHNNLQPYIVLNYIIKT